MKTQPCHPSTLRVRTELRAGGNCYPQDTNCVLLELNGSPVMIGDVPLFSNCAQGFPGAGAACITLQAELKQTFKKDTSCMQC